MRLSRIRFAVFTAMIFAALAADLTTAEPLGRGFTYQGQLKAHGTPLSGNVDLSFSLFDVESGGVSLDVLELANVPVTNGLFTVELDFGVSVFNGDARWLEVAVRSPHDPADTKPFTTLGLRQSLTATPYALQTRGLFVDDVGNVGIGTTTPSFPLHVESDGDMVINALNTATTGFADGVWGQSASTSGRGVFGQAAAPTGTNYGVYGKSASTSGSGVFGLASALSGQTVGVWGQTESTSGMGVFGLAFASSGETFGVLGRSLSTTGRGVFGHANATSGATYGVWGESDSSAGIGVFGRATARTGDTKGVSGVSFSATGRGVSGLATRTLGLNYGVWGRSLSSSGRGVYGDAVATIGATYGVWGQSQSTSGRGVFGLANAPSGSTLGVLGRSDSSSGYGVFGKATNHSGSAYGVVGESASTNGRGMFADATASTGITYGLWSQNASNSGRGVLGTVSASSGTTYGVWGQSLSTSGHGVFGQATATSGTTYGVRGKVSSPNGFAGYFEGKHHVKHKSTTVNAWPVGIQNESHAQHQAGMRVSDNGFFDITNDALDASPNFARLNTSGNWTAVSDRRVKRDIQPLSGALEKAMALEPVSFRFKNDGTHSGRKEIGFIAQEVREQFPSLVTNGELLTLNYSGLSVVAIAAIQEQHHIIERLARENDERESEIGELRNRLKRLESLLSVSKGDTR